MVDRSLYKVGVVVRIDDCSAPKGGKALRCCRVNVGGEGGSLLSVVTSASNVRENSRIVVAPVGSARGVP